jgi:pimeloyl-ACP methyl ester carboxylesterase
VSTGWQVDRDWFASDCLILRAVGSNLRSHRYRPRCCPHSDTFHKRLRDEIAAVEKEIQSHNQQVESLTKGLEGLQSTGGESLRSIIQNWWRQGMMGGAKAHYDGIVAFSQTDFTADLKKITVPVLVMHGDDYQIVPYAGAGPKFYR